MCDAGSVKSAVYDAGRVQGTFSTVPGIKHPLSTITGHCLTAAPKSFSGNVTSLSTDVRAEVDIVAIVDWHEVLSRMILQDEKMFLQVNKIMIEFSWNIIAVENVNTYFWKIIADSLHCLLKFIHVLSN